MSMTCAEIGAVVREYELTQPDVADASMNICVIGKTVLARTHRGEDVAVLQHEKVGFVRATRVPSKLVEVALIERRGAPRCYIPAEAIAPGAS